MGWEPIKTAPRDGTIILVCRKPRYMVAKFHYVTLAKWVTDGGYWIFPALAGTYAQDDDLVAWMPLPEPPQPSGGRK